MSECNSSKNTQWDKMDERKNNAIKLSGEKRKHDTIINDVDDTQWRDFLQLPGAEKCSRGYVRIGFDNDDAFLPRSKEEWYMVGRYIGNTTHVKWLNFHNIMIGDNTSIEEFAAFCEGLKGNTSIEKIGFIGCHVVGGQAIFDKMSPFLAGNANITEMKIIGDKTGAGEGSSMMKMLDLLLGCWANSIH